MAHTNDKEHDDRIREVAGMLDQHPGEALLALVMKRFKVSETLALTYIKRARNRPRSTATQLTLIPSEGPLSGADMDVIGDVIFGGKVDFVPGEDQTLTIGFEQIEQAIALARLIRDCVCKGTIVKTQAAENLAKKLVTGADKERFHDRLFEIGTECGLQIADPLDPSTIEFPSLEEEIRVRSLLEGLQDEAETDGLHEEARGFEVLKEYLDMRIALEHQYEDLDFFCKTLAVLIRAVPSGGNLPMDQAVFQSPEQKETFHAIVIRLAEVISTSEGSQEIRRLLEHRNDTTYTNETWEKMAAQIHDLAQWSRSSEPN
jgi:hypothetical protein